MQLGNLSFLWLLLLIPALSFFYFWAFGDRQKALDRFARHELLEQLVQFVSPARRRWKAVLILSGIFFIVLALAQPKWGYHWEEVKRKGLDVVVALDVSKSMLAEDIKPNRLEAAKREIKNMINLMKGDRIGIVAFAGTAFLQCPLTLDYGTAKNFVDYLDVNSIPLGGTDIGKAIRTGTRAFEGHEKKERVLILITDGEDHGGQAVQAAEDAKKAGVVIFPIAIGRQEGAPIPVVDEEGNKGFTKDREDKIVLSKLDPLLLQKIALITGGKKGSIGAGDFPLEDIYQNEVSRMEKRELESSRQKRYENRFVWPLFAGLLCLVVEALLSERKRNGKNLTTSAFPGHNTLSTPRSRKKVKAVLSVFLLFFILGYANPLFAESAHRAVEEGNKLLASNKFEDALKKYNEAQVKKPESPEIVFNMGNVFYREKKYPEATDAWQKATVKTQIPVQAKAYYNTGNSLVQQGRFEEALELYKRALNLESNDRDAKYNIEYVERKMKEMRSQAPKTQQQAAQDKAKREQDKSAQDKQKSQGAQGKEGEEKKKEQEQQGSKEGEQKEEKGTQDQQQEQAKAEQEKGKEGSEQAGEKEKTSQSQQQPQERKEGQKGAEPKGTPQEELNREQAEQFLQALEQEQKNMILQDQKQSKKGREENVEKDW